MQLGWPELVALLTSLGFGVVSAIVPIANAEAYVIASQVTAVAGPIPIAVGVGLGQSVGKLLLFLGIRRGRDFWFFRRRQHPPAPAPVDNPEPSDQPLTRMARFRAWLHRIVARLLELVGTNSWGLPIVLVAAVVGLPPLYAVTLIAGASRMRALWFWLVVAGGRVARFVVVALGVAGLPCFC
ncbi:hypothetical protein [Microlunatus speluncae]|uniref:hypothetical protein n=1 Tax=Microlunatus speluncae TaxID=2594267 RepID=UPI00126674D4|nr:hypothetical protein [Microlunatus speluncae]